ncbi:MAG: glycoside hydrolase family 3 N-terminal domain-containing protein [Ruminococcus sp.]|nr:glycoside hydrolase family 3 N-terminal domain-containing protein [Ruminococcus sp.]
MKKKLKLAAAAALMITFAACGNIGKADPSAITKKTDADSKPAVSEIDDSSTSSEDTSSSQAEKTEEQLEQEKKEQEERDKIAKTVEKTMKDMSKEEKVGQLFMIRPDALEANTTAENVNSDGVYGTTYVDELMVENMNKYHVGGVVVFEKNISDTDQLKSLIKDLQKSSETPMFVGINEEGGDFAPIANAEGFKVKTFDNMIEIGKTEDGAKAKEVGKKIGGYLSDYGFNLDFAPAANVAADVSSSFGSDPKVVAKMVSNEIKGFHESGIMAAVKHFPGQGGENGAAKTSKDWVELMESDVIPFAEVLGETDMILVGNISTPEVTNDGLPASMSKEIIDEKLRKELGYEGVVVSGPMSSSAVTGTYNSGECAVRAINAGADIVLLPYDLDEAYDTVLKAVKDGTVSEDRLNESVERILTLKAEYGLIK